MKVYDVEQKSEAWFDLRRKVFTASVSAAWIAAENRSAKQEGAAKTAIYKKLAEKSGCEMKPNNADWSMKRGTRLESDAREQYEKETGNTVEEVGFCVHDTALAGASPDGFVNDRKGMVEIKVPESQTHVKYIFEPEEFIKYCKFQAHQQMAVTGCNYVEIFSYCPGLPSVRLTIKRDAFTEDLLRGLIRLSREFKECQSEMKSKWDEMTDRIEDNA